MLKLEDFKAAKKRVDEVILPTHLIHSDAFSEECGNDVYIKPENLQKTSSSAIKQCACPPNFARYFLFMPERAMLVSVTISAPSDISLFAIATASLEYLSVCI